MRRWRNQLIINCVVAHDTVGPRPAGDVPDALRVCSGPHESYNEYFDCSGSKYLCGKLPCNKCIMFWDNFGFDIQTFYREY